MISLYKISSSTVDYRNNNEIVVIRTHWFLNMPIVRRPGLKEPWLGVYPYTLGIWGSSSTYIGRAPTTCGRPGAVTGRAPAMLPPMVTKIINPHSFPIIFIARLILDNI